VGYERECAIPLRRVAYHVRVVQTGTSGRHALIDRSGYRRDPRDGLRRQISEGRPRFLPAMKYDRSICSPDLFMYSATGALDPAWMDPENGSVHFFPSREPLGSVSL